MNFDYVTSVNSVFNDIEICFVASLQKYQLFQQKFFV